MSSFFSKLIQGGPLFMFAILFLLILILVLIVKGFLEKGNNQKTLSLIGSIGLFTVVWGFLGQTIGLIQAFGVIEQVGDISMSIIAGGVKVSLLAPAFGLIVFLIARIGIIVLTWIGKETNPS
jgi:predicted permease